MIAVQDKSAIKACKDKLILKISCTMLQSEEIKSFPSDRHFAKFPVHN